MNNSHEGDGRRGLLRYQTRLLIRHPKIDPAAITNVLGLTPASSWKVGERRKTPAGTLLKGSHTDSMWCHSFNVNGERFFSKSITKMIDIVEANSKLAREIISDGGSIEIIVNLPGDVNIGDSISGNDLGRLFHLGITVGFEVFPAFQ